MKRAFDIVVSATALVGLLPLLAAIALLLMTIDGWPPLYHATRIGKGARPFRMHKFRTMIPNTDGTGPSSTSGDDPRVTRLGAWLRQYKLDELPQLWNVFVGEMSLVGPRPQVSWAVDRYTHEERILLTVRPGITDPASLRFANEAEILKGHPDPDQAYFELIHPEKMRLSLEYVKTRSFASDLRVLRQTVSGAFGKHQITNPSTLKGSGQA